MESDRNYCGAAAEGAGALIAGDIEPRPPFAIVAAVVTRLKPNDDGPNLLFICSSQ